MREGRLVDAMIISAPRSTKNRQGKRDPNMHQTKAVNQWYFGMKAHIGADAASGLVHSVEGTAGSVSDISQISKLLHGEDGTVHADAGYTGVEKRAEIIADGEPVKSELMKGHATPPGSGWEDPAVVPYANAILTGWHLVKLPLRRSRLAW